MISSHRQIATLELTKNVKNFHFVLIFFRSLVIVCNCLFVTQQLISQAIVTAARKLHDETCSDEEFTLTISFIHVAYDRIEKRLTNFCQLVQAQPDIVTSLREVIPPSETEMVSLLLVLKSNPSIENFMRLNLTFLFLAFYALGRFTHLYF